MQAKDFQAIPTRSIVRTRSYLLVLVLLAPLFSGVSAADARAMDLTLEITKKDWWSDETVVVEISMRNAPFNQGLRADWVLEDESGVVMNGSIPFSATGTFTSVDVSLSQFYRGSHFHTLYVSVVDSTNSTLGEDEMAFTMFRQVVMPSAGQLLSFGDSLSDMGNAKASFLNTPDVPPYWQGRFSNGEVWLGYLYDAYGLQSSIGSGIANSGHNRAFGGAQTGSGYAYLIIPNVGSQITSYLSNVQSTIPSNAVVSLWAGGNDFLYGTANADTIAANMESHIRQLSTAGARTFVIPNLPPLEDTPEIQSRSSSAQTTIRNEVIDYNSQLATLVINLQAELNINVYSIDAWNIFGDIMQNKEALGLTNIQDAACSGSSTLLPLPICNSGSSIASNVDEYVFFDKAHPTQNMHKFIARFAVEAIGVADTDGDGVVDTLDQCPWTDSSTTADQQGCAWSQRDSDGDGVVNGEDTCPETFSGDVVDENGCSASQRDSDGDGFNDFIDPCPYSPGLDDYDGDGCSNSEDEDDDQDGVPDTVDTCPRGAIGPHMNDLDGDGCSDTEDTDVDGDGLSNADENRLGTDERNPDTDGDGVLDGDDAFPLNNKEWLDSDLDGCGDNEDVFPFDPSECSDTDEDGYGDNSDSFPADESEWSDLDDDGIGDNSDQCPLEFGLSIHPTGCPDRDGDGYSDTNDDFPSNPNEWVDEDGDGVGDNTDLYPDDPSDWADKDNDTYGDNRDAFPSDPEEWNDTDGEGVGDNADRFPTDASEWNDTDDDGCGDNSDIFPLDPTECEDSDYDGVGDNSDVFPSDALETIDTDGDGLGDNSDAFPNDSKAQYDDDGDGIANVYDAFPQNSMLNSWGGVVLRIGFFLTLISGLIWMLQRGTRSSEFDQMWVYEDVDVESQPFKPTTPPDHLAFSAPPSLPIAEHPVHPQPHTHPVEEKWTTIPATSPPDEMPLVNLDPPATPAETSVSQKDAWVDLGEEWGIE